MATPNADDRDDRPAYVPVPPKRIPWWRRIFPSRRLKNEYARPPSRLAIIMSYVLALFAAVLIAWVGVIALLLLARDVQQPARQAAPVVRALCADEMNQNYQSAYSHLSVDAVGQTLPQFVQWSQQRDQRLGTMQRCQATGENYIREFIDPYEADLNVTVAFAGGAVSQGTIGVHRYTPEQGPAYWAIFHIDPTLNLAPAAQS
jgi:hypothetical protein